LNNNQGVLKDFDVNVIALDHDNNTWCRLSETDQSIVDEIEFDEKEQDNQTASTMNELKRGFEDALKAEELENELDDLQVSPIQSITQPGELEFTPVKSGFLSSFNPFARKTIKIEKVGNYETQVYSVNNIQVLTMKRFEHLSAEDKQKLLELDSALKNSSQLNQRLEDETTAENEITNNERSSRGIWRRRRLQQMHRKERSGEASPHSFDSDQHDEYQHRSSLPPPEPTSITFEQYFNNNYVLVRHEHYNE